MYKQTLYKVVEPIKSNTIKRLNKSKKWEYGYNKENDIVVISKTGQIGEVLEIQGLKIALPLAPKSIYKRSDKKKEQKWSRFDFNPAFSKIKTRFDWDDLPLKFKEHYQKHLKMFILAVKTLLSKDGDNSLLTLSLRELKLYLIGKITRMILKKNTTDI